jgi:hypothetical protein|nr:MAG TPA: hypothetical protein [Caudoviricetes sp.]
MEDEKNNQLDVDEVDKTDSDDEEIVDEDNLDDERDDEFEYDEDGNIIIPDVIDEDAEDEEDAADDEEEQDETDGENNSDENEGSNEENTETEVVKPATDEKDKRIAELEQELTKLKAQGKETLSKLGVKDTGNVLEGLESLAAEADDISVEDYRKKKQETEQADEAKKILQKAEFEKKAAADLAELKKYYPELANVKTIYEIENLVEFGRYRDLGIAPKQAYAAANPDKLRENAANAAKQKSLNETKKHLQSSVPKGSKDTSITMTKKELATWRDLFPTLSDKELVKLYKQSK